MLNPGEEVRKNPIGFTADDPPNVIVNEAFILWVYELQQEIRWLRTQVKK